MSFRDLTFFAFIFGLFFVFQGEPDLWDKWHDQAMKAGCPAPTTIAPAK